MKMQLEAKLLYAELMTVKKIIKTVVSCILRA